LPDDWTLPAEWRRWTHIHFEATDEAIDRSARRFHIHHRKPGREAKFRAAGGSWFHAWQMWCCAERNFAPRTDGIPRLGNAEQLKANQRLTVQKFVESGGKHWWGSGPRPGEPGCRIPLDILAEFGFAPTDATVLEFPRRSRSTTVVPKQATN
jgi:hypothetical protein